MNITELEVRVNNRGGVTYWKDGVIVGKKCAKCLCDKEISEFNFLNKKKCTYFSECKECTKERTRKYRENNREKLNESKRKWAQNNPDKTREINKKYRENNKNKIKQWKENNSDKVREYGKQWRENNSDYCKAYNEQWRKNNPDYCKQWHLNNIEQQKRYREVNKEKRKEYEKQRRGNDKENNLQYISNMVEQINPVFKHLNLPVYGFIYLFTNIKTKHCYIGQTTLPLKDRYKNSNIIQGWIKERLKYDTQKFKEELIEEDIEVTEVLDVAFCEYHLNKLEAHYINKYNSFLNGYNNREGNHNTDDGLNEFCEILRERGLSFENGSIMGGK